MTCSLACPIVTTIGQTGENGRFARKTARCEALQRIAGPSVISQHGVNRRTAVINQYCRVWKESLLLHGDAVPKPLGFIALGQQWLAHTCGGLGLRWFPRIMRGGTGNARPNHCRG